MKFILKLFMLVSATVFAVIAVIKVIEGCSWKEAVGIAEDGGVAVRPRDAEVDALARFEPMSAALVGALFLVALRLHQSRIRDGLRHQTCDGHANVARMVNLMLKVLD